VEGSVAVVLKPSLHYISAPVIHNRPLPSAITSHVEIAPIALSIALGVLSLHRRRSQVLSAQASTHEPRTTLLTTSSPARLALVGTQHIADSRQRQSLPLTDLHTPTAPERPPPARAANPML
jgi:hypothetical protein